MIVGTLDYLAPEQAQNSKLADPRSDIYSLGMTLYFLVTGRPAFETESVIEKLLAHREKAAPSLVGLGPSDCRSAGDDNALLRPSAESGGARPAVANLDSIFQRMVAKRAEERYQTMGEVAGVLESLQREHGELFELGRAGSTEVTGAWMRGSAEKGLTQGHGGTERELAVAEALLGEPAVAPSVDQTPSLVSPLSATTDTQRKPGGITVLGANRPGRALRR